ncbi:unnamed protein product [Ectocarpus sp. 12 AP-2014]
MLRKRQRQELSDVIAGEMDTHGVVDDDKEGDGESKTASFKKKKKRSEQQGTSAPADPAATSAEDTKSKKKNGAVEAVVGSGDGISGGSGAGDAGDDGEKPGGKRKARRKKKKCAAPEVATAEADAAVAAAAASSATVTAATPDKKSATVVEETSPMTAAEAEAGGGGKVAETAEPGESKKQRRGWGKARSKSAGAAAGTAENVNQAKDSGGRSGRTDEHRPRKKTRSRQKNIRKDKRSADERPAYLRAGTPDFSGRGLTEETRKFLGLPQDDFGDAPPAGWGKPGKVRPTASWVIDKKPRRLPKHLEPDAVNEGTNAATTSVAASTDAGRESTPAATEAAPSATGKSKYKNLSLTPVGKTSANKKERAKGSHGPGGTSGVKGKTREKNDTDDQDGV